MDNSSQRSLWTFLVFPGIAMLLGWGLRGYIGGGPFGAMIPGAMVALAISMLLGFRPGFASIVVVFGVVGVGLGGEMTYGQTLGFLRNPETVWWGNIGTTLKGAVWGIGGGSILGLGLIHHRVSNKTILLSFLVFLIGLIVGFKLVNDPKLLYFSDPINKPRSESWAGLLLGAIVFLGYLKYALVKKDFKVILRFAKWGLISGGLGFGLGGLWMVLGSSLQNVLFSSWWKMMEFTFGLLFGMGIGYAAWKSRNDLEISHELDSKVTLSLYKEVILILILSLVIYLFIPAMLEPLVEKMSSSSGFVSGTAGNLLRVLVNFSFYGFVLVLIVLYKKELAWQVGITLTFCHTAIDWARDLRPAPETSLDPLVQLTIVFISTMLVAFFVATYRRRTNINHSMMQVLVWSTVTVAFISLISDIFIEGKFQYTDIAHIIVKTLFVHIVFLCSALYVSIKSNQISHQKISTG